MPAPVGPKIQPPIEEHVRPRSVRLSQFKAPFEVEINFRDVSRETSPHWFFFESGIEDLPGTTLFRSRKGDYFRLPVIRERDNAQSSTRVWFGHALAGRHRSR